MSGLLRGLVRERACRGGAEGEARSAVLYWGSLTVPRAEAAGTRGRGVPGDGAWHWDVRAPDTVSTPPTGGARALSFGASHPAPSPWVELGSTQGVVWCGMVWCGVVWCDVVCSAVLCYAVLCYAIQPLCPQQSAPVTPSMTCNSLRTAQTIHSLPLHPYTFTFVSYHTTKRALSISLDPLNIALCAPAVKLCM